MLDPKVMREEIDQVAQMLKNRNNNVNLEEYTALENQRKSLQTEVEAMQSERNSKSKNIGIAKSQGEDVEPLLKEVADLGDNLKSKHDELNIIQAKIKDISLHIPNLLNKEVPIGKDESENKEVKKMGKYKNL